MLYMYVCVYIYGYIYIYNIIYNILYNIIYIYMYIPLLLGKPWILAGLHLFPSSFVDFFLKDHHRNKRDSTQQAWGYISKCKLTTKGNYPLAINRGNGKLENPCLNGGFNRKLNKHRYMGFLSSKPMCDRRTAEEGEGFPLMFLVFFWAPSTIVISWLVLWNHGFLFDFPYSLRSQLAFTHFSGGQVYHQPVYYNIF